MCENVIDGRREFIGCVWKLVYSLMDWKNPKVDDCGYNEGLFV